MAANLHIAFTVPGHLGPVGERFCLALAFENIITPIVCPLV
jgi:hypothetical protein